MGNLYVKDENWPTRVDKRRFTFDEFFGMSNTLNLFNNQRVELIDGEIFEMPMQHHRQVNIRTRLAHQFYKLLENRADVLQLLPITPESKFGKAYVEPDLTLVRAGSLEKFAYPKLEDVMLVVEISHNSRRYDLEKKMPLYAGNRIPECWCVNLRKMQLEVYREPNGETYKSKNTLEVGQECSLLEFPDVMLEWW